MKYTPGRKGVKRGGMNFPKRKNNGSNPLEVDDDENLVPPQGGTKGGI